ncbi:hypothetical protein CsatA_000807 [Cannabis sativa]
MHLWRSSPWGIYPICGSGIPMLDWVKFIWDLKNKGLNSDEVFLYSSLTADTIWQIRNEKVHNNTLFYILQCVDSIRSTYAAHHASVFPCSPPCLAVAWSLPPQDWIKLNCDVKVGFDSMCIAVVARDHLSKVIWVYTARVDFANVLCGEAAACCFALDIAKNHAFKFIMVESDSRIVINALNKTESRWELENHVSFCIRSSSSFISCIFCHTSRNCNFSAHNVAKWAFTHQRFGCLPIHSIPEQIFCNDREV